MVQQEFYIREQSENSARGPFNLEQVISFGEMGSLTPETLYYDAASETWVSFSSQAEVSAAVFPAKRKLTLRAKEVQQIQTLNLPSTVSKPPINVDDMLAAAEGRTKDTKEKLDPAPGNATAARLGLRASIVALVLAAAGETLPAADALSSMDAGRILGQPLAILGGLDLLFALMLTLGSVSLYPLVRVRAALGFGLFGVLFYSQGMPLPLLAAVAGSGGLYMATILVETGPVVGASVAAVGGMGGLAYFLLAA